MFPTEPTKESTMSQEKMPWMLEEQLDRRATLALKGLILEKKKLYGITAMKSRQSSARNVSCGFFSTV